MKILIIIILTFIFKSSVTLGEEVKMMECRLVETLMHCTPKDDCDSSSYNKSYSDTSYYLSKYVKTEEGDEIYYRDEGKWKIFSGLGLSNGKDVISYKKEISDYTGYYKYVVDRGGQVFEFWYDFFYPSRKWSHSVYPRKGDKPSTLTRYFKCRKYKN